MMGRSPYVETLASGADRLRVVRGLSTGDRVISDGVLLLRQLETGGHPMIRRIVSTSLHQRLLIGMLVVVFVADGIAAFRALPVEAFPDVTDVQVNVITLVPGHAP
jgi:AcrB/AcrD/AcrF family